MNNSGKLQFRMLIMMYHTYPRIHWGRIRKRANQWSRLAIESLPEFGRAWNYIPQSFLVRSSTWTRNLPILTGYNFGDLFLMWVLLVRQKVNLKNTGLFNFWSRIYRFGELYLFDLCSYTGLNIWWKFFRHKFQKELFAKSDYLWFYSSELKVASNFLLPIEPNPKFEEIFRC